MIVAALAFLAAYAIPILNTHLDPTARLICDIVTAVVWVIFIAEYLIRLLRAKDRRYFFTHNLFDLVILIVPIARPFRMLRLITLLSVLNRAGTRSLRGRVAVYACGGALLLLIVASLAITDAERGRPGSTINGVGDGLWWAVETMTTVGYGDRIPQTTTGHLIAVVLMFSGIALLGVATAFVASWLVQALEETEEAEEQTHEAVLTLTEEVRALRAEIAELRESRREAAPDAEGQD